MASSRASVDRATDRMSATPVIPRRRRALRLSTRVTLFFAIAALLGGSALTVTTYLFARNSLLDQRATSAERTAIARALEVNSQIGEGSAAVRQMMFGIENEGSGWSTYISAADSSITSQPGRSRADFPSDLVETARRGQYGRQYFLDREGTPWLGVGIGLNAHDAAYLEAFPLDDTQRTLRLLATALVVGSILATLLATSFGWSTSRRMLRPVARVADAAAELASGGLDTRLEEERDPDLNRLAGSFNEMADAVQDRIEREQRFASDVSHELRSPITALSAAVEVLDARRDDLPERTQQALDLVIGQVRRFDAMVIDLLELSRLDAGATDSNPELVDLPDLCERVAQRYGYSDLPIEVGRRARREAFVDRIRFERILGNLLDNAHHHGGGATRISIEQSPQKRSTQLAVEDGGPGVAVSERTRIFERFARGSAARNRIGTGLGLALVAEHAAALGGEAWVEDRPGGGARFIVRLPAEPS